MQKKILVADDDYSILDAIKIILEDEHYSVETVSNGDEVYENIIKKKPNLVLLDIWMSGSDGSEICRALKQSDDTKFIPIIMISASTEIERLTNQCHANDFIMKPFDIDELVNKVKKYLKE